MDQDQLKRAAAEAAARIVTDGMYVGLGSGSTMQLVIEALGRRIAAAPMSVTGVPTSYQARALARAAGIPVCDPVDAPRVDLALDGADEIDPHGNLVKGAGGAHVVEKVIAAWARRFVVVADKSKLVATLGEHYPIPVEVILPAITFVLARLTDLGLRPVLRTGAGKVGPVISENGNPLIDVRISPGRDLVGLDRELNQIPGLLGHGLFIGMADEAIVARDEPGGIVVETRQFQKS